MAQKKSVSFALSSPCASLEDCFVLEEFLSSDRGGHTRIVRDCISRKRFVLKSLFLKEVHDDEISALRAVVGHPNIVQLIGLFEDENGMHILMDYCKGGDLSSYLLSQDHPGRLPEREAAVIVKQIASALKICHSNAIIHRNVNCETVLIAGNLIHGDGNYYPYVKLIGFSCCTVLPHPNSLSEGFAGSKKYAAPEMVESMSYCCKVDIWSLGLLLYQIISGYAPFSSNNELPRSDYDWEARMREKKWLSIPRDVKGLILWMLKRDPKKRASAEEVLEHPWIKRHTNQRMFVESEATGIAVAPVVVESPRGDCIPKKGFSKSTSFENLKGDMVKEQLKQGIKPFICKRRTKSVELETLSCVVKAKYYT